MAGRNQAIMRLRLLARRRVPKERPTTEDGKRKAENGESDARNARLTIVATAARIHSN